MALRIATLVLTGWAAATAQTLIDPDQIPKARKAFESAPDAAQLRCEVTSIRPALNYAFRFQTGYVIDLPLSQFSGAGHKLRMLVQVTPEGRDPVYLTHSQGMPEVPATDMTGELSGAFIVGEGAYAVEALAEDEQRRVCRGKWHIQAKRSGSERNLSLATRPGSVAELQPGNAEPQSKSGHKIERLTLLVHAASLSRNAAKPRPDDVAMLVDSVASLLEQMPARFVRLVMFNLDQQAVLLRKDGLTREDLGEVIESFNNLDLATVDYRALKQRDAPGDMLTGLLQTELHDPKPPDAVIVLGPRTRPRAANGEATDRPAAAAGSPIFYLQYQQRQFRMAGPGPRPGRGPRGRIDSADPNEPGVLFDVAPNNVPDRIQQAVGRFKGETIAIESPHDFADAIRRMVTRVPTVADSTVAQPQTHSQTQLPGAVRAGPLPLREDVKNGGDEDPTDVLVRLRDQVLAHAARIPNHTCVETVERDRYEPVTGRSVKSCDALLARRKQSDFPQLIRLDVSDRLRLDVKMTTDREIYSWAGASKFEEGDIDQLVPEGAMGTGPFGAMLVGLFENRGPSFVFEGDSADAGRRVFEYSFRVPRESSYYRVKARKEWLITGYTGTLLVDPRTAEVVRVTVRTEELPEETGSCETDTTMEFGMVPLGGLDYLLPKMTRQRFIARDGLEAENHLTFAACRVFKGESKLTFGESSAAPGSAKSAAAPEALPPGLPVTVELLTPVRGTESAAGDRIEGRLTKPIRDASGHVLAPEGARLQGRLMRVETGHTRRELTIALHWETLERDGIPTPFWAIPTRRPSDLRTFGRPGLQRRGMEIELPLPSEGRYGVYHFPGERAVVESGFLTEWSTAAER